MQGIIKTRCPVFCGSHFTPRPFPKVGVGSVCVCGDLTATESEHEAEGPSAEDAEPC